MPLIQWDETMAVGMDELDDQHMELIDLINEVYEAIQRHDEPRMSHILDKMRDYAVIHFETEEAILSSCRYPDVAGHARQHQNFTDRVDDFKCNMLTTTNLSQVFIFLSRWLTNHIMNEDREFIPWLPQKNDEGA
ncbi:bacteriohemerythrin [Pseudodesulfovibrio thermohalotolerans]|uniref:bacteriohemerythrin n=1 Tax=Pseudodesulfovibrio thermohalotolerans TaxID=2880651 RepID=UPI0024423B4D|nr:bacteriohemerythrin [Pseudodesulfovibrio thermohalotolerans]WFS61333.1 bacteriohemerythrin [Pseudodesulfovibrio thermohalotolerans]